MQVATFVISTLFFGILGIYMNFDIAGFIFGGLLVICYQLQTLINLLRKEATKGIR